MKCYVFNLIKNCLINFLKNFYWLQVSKIEGNDLCYMSIDFKMRLWDYNPCEIYVVDLQEYRIVKGTYRVPLKYLVARSKVRSVYYEEKMLRSCRIFTWKINLLNQSMRSRIYQFMRIVSHCKSWATGETWNKNEETHHFESLI